MAEFLVVIFPGIIALLVFIGASFVVNLSTRKTVVTRPEPVGPSPAPRKKEKTMPVKRLDFDSGIRLEIADANMLRIKNLDSDDEDSDVLVSSEELRELLPYMEAWADSGDLLPPK